MLAAGGVQLLRAERTFSGTGIGFMGCFFSGSADSLCLMRFAAEGEEGSSSALRFGADVSVSIASTCRGP